MLFFIYDLCVLVSVPCVSIEENAARGSGGGEGVGRQGVGRVGVGGGGLPPPDFLITIVRYYFIEMLAR